MWQLIKAGVGLISGHRSYITLIGLSIAAAGLYAWGASARSDRDRILAWAEKTCASTGREFAPTGKAKRGALCATRIAELDQFEREMQAETARILAQNNATRKIKATADIATATAQSHERHAAAQQMEKSNAQILPDDRVGSDWFGSLNRVAGLRPSRE